MTDKHASGRRRWRGPVAAVMLGLAAALPARAEIAALEIIAPAGPGGGYDQHARALQQVLQDRGLAENIQVMNVPGAGGTIGLAQFVTGRKRSPSLMIAGIGMEGAILLNESPVTLDQVTPLARLTGEYQPLFVAADSPIRTLDDLAAMYRADPGSVSWGGFAAGSPDHMISALVVKAIGGDVAQMNYVPSGAGGELIAAVMGGHLTVGTAGFNEVAGQIQAGKLRALGISSPERLPGVDVPTFREQGVDVTFVNWRGVMAPAGMRPGDLEDLAQAVDAVVKSPEWQAILQRNAWLDMYMPSDAFQAFLDEDQAQVEGILTELGLVQP
ncbi:Bug family tripartite tricarboxylate transporter substrate binding protein [Marinivivus vitaminiproducens]|uniref:Bug family tripartite tricarboxylate transporter substrate binding protein n=1 Tax=Marinivivus vitaminiproducens TaxID=3035935 RepID=UPI0027A02CA0|nr:tripartite tricarboxylate transporter substrate-binding protein [Geminicoccaceae bacterium SCSIO 64248]